MNIAKQLVLYYLRCWARIALRIAHPKEIIGIAGSAGKSSTKHAIDAALRDHVVVKTLKGNSETGVPLSILGIDPDGYGLSHWLRMLLLAPFRIGYLRGTTHLVVEMGIDSPLWPHNMEYLLTIVKPTIAIALNISATHTEQFEAILPAKEMNDTQRREYILHKMAAEDTKIISASGCHTGIINTDDTYIRAALEHTTASLQTFGSNAATATYDSYAPSLNGTTFHVTIDGTVVVLHIADTLLPQVYESSFAAALLAARAAGISLEDAVNGIEQHFTLPAGRSSLFEGVNNSSIIDSSYNASKQPVLTFLELAKRLKKETQRPIVFVFGDMRELGKTAPIEHREVAAVAATVADQVLCVGELTQQHVVPYIQDAHWFTDSRTLGNYLREHMPAEAIVLVKGSQNTIFLEEAVAAVLKNHSDITMLCRQSSFWQREKNLFFERVQESAHNGHNETKG